MGSIRSMNGREAIELAKAWGYEDAGITGGHQQLRHPKSKVKVPVKAAGRADASHIPTFVIRQLAEGAGVSAKEFVAGPVKVRHVEPTANPEPVSSDAPVEDVAKPMVFPGIDAAVIHFASTRGGPVFIADVLDLMRPWADSSDLRGVIGRRKPPDVARQLGGESGVFSSGNGVDYVWQVYRSKLGQTLRGADPWVIEATASETARIGWWRLPDDVLQEIMVRGRGPRKRRSQEARPAPEPSEQSATPPSEPAPAEAVTVPEGCDSPEWETIGDATNGVVLRHRDGTLWKAERL